MSSKLRCSQGHEWEPAPGELAGGARSICPVCGETERTLTLAGEPTSPAGRPVSAPSTSRPEGAPTALQLPPELETYEVLEEIGHGGMGIVYKARHRGHHRIVALKVIRKDRLANSQTVARFRREARAAARLSHPNIVLVLEYDLEGDTHFLAMEYVPGVTLQEIIEQEGALSAAQACDYMRQVALGLQHAHEQALIHRDIKPANLMVTGPASAPRRTVKILDMGVARLHHLSSQEESLTTLTQHGVVIGTPDYIAPEQLEDPHGADIRADLYSLGCTFYFLLSGQVPFPGGTLIQKLDRQRWEVPPSVDQLRPNIPPAVAAVVRRLMAKSAADRFQTPAELAEALERLDRGATRTAALTPFVRLEGHRGAVLGIAFLPGGQLLSGGADRTVRLWDVAAGRETRKFDLPREASGLAVTTDGRAALVASGVTLRLLEIQTGKELLRFTGHLDTVRAVAFAPNGRYAASGGDDRAVRLWDVQSGRPVVRLLGHSDGISGVAFSPDGRMLVSSSRDQTLRLWDVPAGRELRTFAGPRGPVLGVVCCPDNLHLASAHFDTMVRLWDRETGREMRRFQGHRQMVATVACSSDGILASGSADRTLIVWDPESGVEIRHGEGQAGPVSCVAFTPEPAGGENRTIASAGADGTILLWKVPKE
jgi:WD40 repeat protein/tRNA A-37 threonylcarbamoyl transferase component Bud32